MKIVKPDPAPPIMAEVGSTAVVVVNPSFPVAFPVSATPDSVLGTRVLSMASLIAPVRLAIGDSSGVVVVGKCTRWRASMHSASVYSLKGS